MNAWHIPASNYPTAICVLLLATNLPCFYLLWKVIIETTMDNLSSIKTPLERFRKQHWLHSDQQHHELMTHHMVGQISYESYVFHLTPFVVDTVICEFIYPYYCTWKIFAQDATKLQKLLCLPYLTYPSLGCSCCTQNSIVALQDSEISIFLPYLGRMQWCGSVGWATYNCGTA